MDKGKYLEKVRYSFFYLTGGCSILLYRLHTTNYLQLATLIDESHIRLTFFVNHKIVTLNEVKKNIQMTPNNIT